MKSSFRSGSPSYWVSAVDNACADGASSANDGTVSPLRPKLAVQLVSAGPLMQLARRLECFGLVSALADAVQEAGASLVCPRTRVGLGTDAVHGADARDNWRGGIVPRVVVLTC